MERLAVAEFQQRGMVPNSYEMAASTLLCGEDSSSILDLEAGTQEEEEVLLARSRTRGEPSVVFPVPSEDCVAGFVEAEAAHMPREDYAERLRGGGTDLRVRTDAIDWIWKVGRWALSSVNAVFADLSSLCSHPIHPGYESDSFAFASRQVHAYYGFGPLTACLAVNYLDRFLSLYQLPVRIVKAYEVMVEWHCLLLGSWNKNGV
jgi:cyclin D1/2/4, plant